MRVNLVIQFVRIFYAFQNMIHASVTLQRNLARSTIKWKKRGKDIDPLGRPTVMTYSDYYFHKKSSVRPFLLTFHSLSKQNKLKVKTVIATGGNVGLAEGIIDDTFLVYINVGDSPF